MPPTWWPKALTALALVLLSIYVLVPTVAGWPADLEDAPAGTVPAIAKLFPDSRLRLGLDLQGGIDLTLEVDIDSAITNKVQRDLRQVESALEKETIAFESVTRPQGTAEIAVVLKDDGDLSRARKVMQTQVGIYQYDRNETLEGRSAAIFVLQPEWRSELAKNAVDQVIETLRNRIDEFGVAERSINARGENRINIQLPGLDDPERAIKIIGKTAQLEFRMVDDSWGDARRVQALVDAAIQEKGLGETYTDQQLNEAVLGQIPENTEILWEKEYDPLDKTMKRTRPYLLKKEVSLTGDYIEDAQVSQNQLNMPYVMMELNRQGAKIFEDLTEANVGKQMAIVLDGTINSAPVIREKIGGGRASIEMGSGNIAQLHEEARDLSLVLRAGALPAPVRIIENRTVGATLGADSIRNGMMSFAIGSCMVLVFMVINYGRAGMVANLMLVFNVLFLMASLAFLGATLTLPGIAGVVLTVGMAVDANVIIYERMREEIRLGRTPQAVVDEGYSKAMSAILDSNITTFMAGAVLYSYGSGPVKGFAVTLMVGIITSILSGVWISELWYQGRVSGGRVKRLVI